MYELPKGYDGKQVVFFDCTETYPKEQFFMQEGTHVAESALGRYLETSDKALSRFGYRFPIENKDKPHMLVLRFPDDKRRHMLINDCFSYDLSTGVITGGEYPVTNQVQTIYYLFYTRTNDMTITFTTWGEGEPAAVFGFAIYELDQLPESEQIKAEIPTRKLGVQYEDPCGAQGDLGVMTYPDWSKRILQFAKTTGQNMLVYPINWYAGPTFPCESQPSSVYQWVTLPDHTQHTITSTQPKDWVSPLLDECERAGIDFVGGMTLLRLGNLLKNMNIDLDSIVQGKDTYNNMRCDNKVQTSVNDWTIEYNAKNAQAMIAQGRKKWDVTDFTYAYGEKRDSFGGAPMFNPLHPEVQKQLIEYFEEISEKYGKKKAFKGVSVNIWHGTMLWFGSLMLGYDDYTAELFYKETGIKVPCEPNDPSRFEKRYTYLTRRNRKLWIDWRCKKMHELIVKLRDALQKHNPDLTLYICAWNEPVKRTMFGQFTASSQYPVFLSETEFLREGGLDFGLFEQDRGISFSMEQNQHRDRGWDMRGLHMPTEETRFFHDISYMDGSWCKPLRKMEQSGCFVMDSWNEVWGEHIRHPFDLSKEKLKPVLETISDGEIHTYEQTLKSADDGFWFESQRQITSCYPVGRSYLEPYAHALAETDALYLLRGGLYLDKAHTALISEYASVFTKLPAVKFEDIKGANDPIAMRQISLNGKMYAYAVNREPYDVSVSVTLTKNTEVFDLATGEKIKTQDNKVTLSLKPFGLSAITAQENAVASFEIQIPEAEWEKITKMYEQQLCAFEKADGIAGLEQVKAQMQDAFENKRIAKLRHILKCYVSEKARK